MKIDYDIAMEIASHEAIIRQAYKDSVGKWTWSVGLTSATGHVVERYIGKPQSLEHCLRVYVWALDNYAHEVREAFKGVALTKAQFAAALSFHWNTGAIKKASWVKKFKAGDIAGAKKAFMSYNKPKEIIGRRTKERDLFFSGKWSNNGTMTEYTRLTAASTPDWKSGRRINVEHELKQALAGEVPASDKVITEKKVPVEVPVEIEKPTVPQKVDEKVKQKTSFWQWLMGIGSSGALSLGWLGGMDYQAILAIGIVVIAAMIIVLVLRRQILGAVKDIRDTVEGQ